MKLMSLLLGLLLIIYLMSKQLAPQSPSNNMAETTDTQTISLPQVPTSSKDLKKFETDMNDFVQETVETRNAALEKALNE